MKIFTLKVYLAYDDQFPGEDPRPWSKVIEVKEDITYEELHKDILQIVGFKNINSYEFYISNKVRGFDAQNNNHVTVLGSVKLNNVHPQSGEKIYYINDVEHFAIKLEERIFEEDTEAKYPRTVKSNGFPPLQDNDYIGD